MNSRFAPPYANVWATVPGRPVMSNIWAPIPRATILKIRREADQAAPWWKRITG